MVGFKTAFSSKWKWSGDNIDKLETKTSLLGLQHMASSPRTTGKRLLSLVDNTTTLGAVTKGRPSSWVLNNICREIDAVSLKANLCVLGHLIPSALNPADSPSRNAPLWEACRWSPICLPVTPCCSCSKYFRRVQAADAGVYLFPRSMQPY